MQPLSVDDLSQILEVSNISIQELVNAGKIPYKMIGDRIIFYPDIIGKWINEPLLNMDHEKYVERFKKRVEDNNSEQLKAIQEFCSQYAEPRIPRKYYLNKVKNKKLGFVYYVRYLENGRLVPTSWCTHTNDYEKADNFAKLNRDILLSRYYAKAVEKKPYFNIYSVFKNYYAENSTYLQIDIKRGRSVCENARRLYYNFMNRQFIPFLRKERIKDVDQIDTSLLSKFQNYLLTDRKIKDMTGKIKTIPGIKPQTIKIYIGQISLIFDHLIQENKVTINPVKSLIKIKVKDVHKKATGCYEIEKLKGVFNRKWKDERSYILTLLIYTTDMRNSEIENIQLNDIFLIDKIHFMNIASSKTPNGVRIVPIHDFVYSKLMSYVRKNDIKDYIFKPPNVKKLASDVYKKAYLELAKYTGYTEEQLVAENIKFYSGRHFWKTLMNSENLGDIEEYFMGHKVSSDVAKRYNHRDKQGKKKLLEKTKKVFDILDRKVFNI